MKRQTSASGSQVAKVKASSLAEPGKSDVLYELGVKEKQFQKGLAAALPGDTVLVLPGTYYGSIQLVSGARLVSVSCFWLKLRRTPFDSSFVSRLARRIAPVFIPRLFTVRSTSYLR